MKMRNLSRLRMAPKRAKNRRDDRPSAIEPEGTTTIRLLMIDGRVSLTRLDRFQTAYKLLGPGRVLNHCAIVARVDESAGRDRMEIWTTPPLGKSPKGG
jgi:hypothetical protein